jgi:hypothetical protein
MGLPDKKAVIVIGESSSSSRPEVTLFKSNSNDLIVFAPEYSSALILLLLFLIKSTGSLRSLKKNGYCDIPCKMDVVLDGSPTIEGSSTPASSRLTTYHSN